MCLKVRDGLWLRSYFDKCSPLSLWMPPEKIPLDRNMTSKTFSLAPLTGHQWGISSINEVSSPGGETENYWKELRYIRFNSWPSIRVLTGIFLVIDLIIDRDDKLITPKGCCSWKEWLWLGLFFRVGSYMYMYDMIHLYTSDFKL